MIVVIEGDAKRPRMHLAPTAAKKAARPRARIQAALGLVMRARQKRATEFAGWARGRRPRWHPRGASDTVSSRRVLSFDVEESSWRAPVRRKSRSVYGSITPKACQASSFCPARETPPPARIAVQSGLPALAFPVSRRSVSRFPFPVSRCSRTVKAHPSTKGYPVSPRSRRSITSCRARYRASTSRIGAVRVPGV